MGNHVCSFIFLKVVLSFLPLFYNWNKKYKYYLVVCLFSETNRIKQAVFNVFICAFKYVILREKGLLQLKTMYMESSENSLYLHSGFELMLECVDVRCHLYTKPHKSQQCDSNLRANITIRNKT